jgi:hypothetical protein
MPIPDRPLRRDEHADDDFEADVMQPRPVAVEFNMTPKKTLLVDCPGRAGALNRRKGGPPGAFFGNQPLLNPPVYSV